MPPLGVITDGITRDFERALAVMQEIGLQHAELQFLWDKEVGDLTDGEWSRARMLIDQYRVQVSCISRHVFGGMLVTATEVGDASYQRQMAALKRCIEMAKDVNCERIRIMSFRREMILFGSQGAEQWIVSKGAWEKLLQLLRPAVQLAEDHGVTLVLETGNNAMITSGHLGRKLIDEMGSRHLKILWDPANSLYACEPTYPDGYDALGVDGIGHLHIKDCVVDMPKATVRFCELGTGQMARYLEPLAAALKRDGYKGGISLESVYRPDGREFEDGFRASVQAFQRLFS